VTRQEIEDAVGITGLSITWHMKRLEEDHLILMQKDGRTTAYTVPAPVAGYLARQIVSPITGNA